MVVLLSVLIFGGALAASVGIIAATVAPQWSRILSLASGQREASFMPLAALARAERRIAVRRWGSAPATARHRRAAA